MLAEDARLVMPPLPTWVSGREQVAGFLRAYPLSGARRWQMVPTSANGQPALATYSWDEQSAAFMAHSLSVLTLREGKIEEITAFMTPDPFPHFQPARIDRRLATLQHRKKVGPLSMLYAGLDLSRSVSTSTWLTLRAGRSSVVAHAAGR